MLLWVLMLAGWGAVFARRGRRLPTAISVRVLAVLGLVSVGFSAFVLLTSNPFIRLDPVPPDGADLNPLLQDWGMILHPPLLYMGYVGCAVTFAFAVAGLLAGRLDSAWARWVQPWSLMAWVFLTIGIALGSWWAYRELGWGGWWFWDPTENASLMPWLAATALIHSLAVTARRGHLLHWTLFLSIGVFSLSLLGTFLIRSGVLSSVHAFAMDPTRGLFILGLLALVIGGSLALYAWRYPRTPALAGFGWLSRESMLLGNVLLLMAALATVMLGTLYPLLLDVFGLGKVSVGPPYFDAVFVPVMAPLLMLMAIGPLTDWHRADPRRLVKRMRWAFAAALAVAVAIPLVQGGARPWVSLGLFLAFWILLTLVLGLIERLTGRGDGRAAAPRRLTRGFVGMQIAHTGMAVLVVGITLVSAYSIERDVRLDVGESVELAGHRFTLRDVTAHTGPNYVADRGVVEVVRADGRRLTLYPEKRLYNASRMAMTEAALHVGAFGDLYVSLGDYLGGRAWSLRLYRKPFIGWLWAGATLMALGGLLAATRRTRVGSG